MRKQLAGTLIGEEQKDKENEPVNEINSFGTDAYLLARS